VIHEHKNLIDGAAAGFALVAGISLSQTALVVSILAGMASLILFGIRLHDRLRYGPPQR
jgi:hypothetical protein